MPDAWTGIKCAISNFEGDKINMLNPAAKTAYSEAESIIYDSKRFSSRSGKKIHQTEMESLKIAIKLVPNTSKVLEVGCGTGRFLLELCKAGYKVDGLDASPHMLKQCGEMIKDRFPDPELTLGEAAKLPFPDNSYDFVYSIRLLNQTGSSGYALDVLTDMIRVAKPDGYILVEFCNYYRPRIKGCNDRGVHLRPEEVIEQANNDGAKLVWSRGSFFFGMTALIISPSFLVGLVNNIDQSFSRLFPKLCSRCYILFQKK